MWDPTAVTTLTVMPVIESQQAHDCIRAMDPAFRAQMLVVDNTRVLFSPPSIPYLAHGKGHNLGVAASWCIGAERVLNEGLDWLILLSASVRFGKSGGTDLLNLLADTEPLGIWMPPAPVDMHVACIPRSLLETVGTFDANYYPCYAEDTDLRRRVRLAGLPERFLDGIDVTYTRPGAGYDVLKAQSNGRPVLDANWTYHREKWGGPPGEETYDTPYGEDVPLSYMRPAPDAFALAERYGVGAP